MAMWLAMTTHGWPMAEAGHRPWLSDGRQVSVFYVVFCHRGIGKMRGGGAAPPPFLFVWSIRVQFIFLDSKREGREGRGAPFFAVSGFRFGAGPGQNFRLQVRFEKVDLKYGGEVWWVPVAAGPAMPVCCPACRPGRPRGPSPPLNGCRLPSEAYLYIPGTRDPEALSEPRGLHGSPGPPRPSHRAPEP